MNIPFWNTEKKCWLVGLLRDKWSDSSRIPMTAFKGSQCEDPTLLISDLGDITPFLYAIGEDDLSVKITNSVLDKTLHHLNRTDNQIILFYNHDYLLGIIELARLTKNPALIQTALSLFKELETVEFAGFLVDRTGPRSPLFYRSNPFNGGYIELACDLYSISGEEYLVELAGKWAMKWLSLAYFNSTSLFPRITFPYIPLAGAFAGLLSSHGPVRIFKDNTNLVWGLLALYKITGDTKLQKAILKWAKQISKIYDRYTGIPLAPGSRNAYSNLMVEGTILDLFCDLIHNRVESAEIHNVVCSLVSKFRHNRWPNGALPVESGSSTTHFDSLTDLGVALHKAGEVLDNAKHKELARDIWESSFGLHYSEDGFFTSVTIDGHVADPRIFVKYQILSLKSPILIENSQPIYKSTNLWLTLRDR